MPRRERWGAIDRVVTAGLVCATLFYLVWLPRNLGHTDEGYFLYHAKRILQGQVAFRDYHELYMPLSHYGMALLFRIFGVTMGTATLAFAAVHAATLALLYRTARLLGARAGLAALAAVAHLALAEPTWPHASPHWVAALVMVGLLHALVAGAGSGGRRAWLWPGLLAGVLFGVQHQKAVPLAAGVGLYALIGSGLERRFRPAGAAGTGPTPASRLLLLVGGAAAFALPFLLIHLWLAGPALLEQLFVEPFTTYREINRGRSWGSVDALAEGLLPYTVLPLLVHLPWVIPIALVRGALAWRAGDLPALRTQVLAACFCSAAAASILYRPDFIHIGFVAAAFLPFWAETGEWVLAHLERATGSPWARRLAPAAIAAGLVAGGAHLAGNAERFRARYRYTVDTAFGRVDVEHEAQAETIREVLRVMAGLPRRELLAYPAYAAMYLMADADNPSPHDYNQAGYKTPAQVQETLDALEARRLPYVVAVTPLLSRRDPVLRHLKRHYDCVRLVNARCVLFRRKDWNG